MFGSQPLYVIGAIGHWAIYTALLCALVPFPNVAAYIVMACIAALAAAAWPIVDYFVVAVLATISVGAATLVLIAAISAAWLSARLAEKMEEIK